MTYDVTAGGFDKFGKPAPVGLDLGHDLETAREIAFDCITRGETNVTIKREDGRIISGDDLLACYEGKKILTPELEAVPRAA